MFGFTKKKVSIRQVVESLIKFSTDESAVDAYKELFETDKITSSQKREIYIFNMHATVIAIQSSIDSKDLTEKILNFYHLSMYQLLSPDHKSQLYFEELVNRRYENYYTFTNSIENETSLSHLGQEFLNNFFGNKDYGKNTFNQTIVSSMYINHLTTIKGFLDEVQTKYTLI
jgi:hypothetical protein